jgi:hypothetical protein
MHLDPWISTHGGRQVSLLYPKAASIDINDIAHHLALINRFGGATRQPYCVAQHSMLVAEILKVAGHPPRTQLYGLLHDAKEFVIGDVMSPVKVALFGTTGFPTDLDELEGEIDLAIYERFGLPEPREKDLQAVAQADHVALATEWRDLMPKAVLCPIQVEACFKIVVPLHWEFARRHFLAGFYALMLESGLPTPAESTPA